MKIKSGVVDWGRIFSDPVLPALSDGTFEISNFGRSVVRSGQEWSISEFGLKQPILSSFYAKFNADSDDLLEISGHIDRFRPTRWSGVVIFRNCSVTAKN